MKIMFASDLHGSFYYCEKIREIYEKEKVDKLVLLGDILYHGPRNPLPKEYSPKDVIKVLNNMEKNILCIRGNCDSEVDQMVLNFPIMSDYSILNIDDINMLITHGHIYNKDNYPSSIKDGIIICGHTHLHTIEELDDIIYINPGSISMPKEGQENSYMIYEDRKFIIKNINGKELKSISI